MSGLTNSAFGPTRRLSAGFSFNPMAFPNHSDERSRASVRHPAGSPPIDRGAGARLTPSLSPEAHAPRSTPISNRDFHRSEIGCCAHSTTSGTGAPVHTKPSSGRSARGRRALMSHGKDGKPHFQFHSCQQRRGKSQTRKNRKYAGNVNRGRNEFIRYRVCAGGCGRGTTQPRAGLASGLLAFSYPEFPDHCRICVSTQQHSAVTVSETHGGPFARKGGRAMLVSPSVSEAGLRLGKFCARKIRKGPPQWGHGTGAITAGRHLSRGQRSAQWCDSPERRAPDFIRHRRRPSAAAQQGSSTLPHFLGVSSLLWPGPRYLGPALFP